MASLKLSPVKVSISAETRFEESWSLDGDDGSFASGNEAAATRYFFGRAVACSRKGSRPAQWAMGIGR